MLHTRTPPSQKSYLNQITSQYDNLDRHFVKSLVSFDLYIGLLNHDNKYQHIVGLSLLLHSNMESCKSVLENKGDLYPQAGLTRMIFHENRDDVSSTSEG